MRIDFLTLFPEMFGGVLRASIIGRAADEGIVSFHVHDIRDFADNRHQKVDDRPFGGGPGMVMMCQPLFDCVRAVEALDERPALRVLLTPQGDRLRQPAVEALATAPRLLLIAGHYEGVDERVVEELSPVEISIGDYVLSGGELPSMVLADAVVRLLPGALGHADSASEDSFAAPAESASRAGETEAAAGARTTDGPRLLDCPHYTRPRLWRGRTVPEVLVSGDHEAVAAWRREQRLERTRVRRPDLLPAVTETTAQRTSSNRSRPLAADGGGQRATSPGRTKR